jgi:tetratricopeptide (TPR) repeat protein
LAAACLIALAALCLTLRAVAADVIVKTDGTTISGHITAVSNGAALVESDVDGGGVARFPVMLTDIKSVTMAAPPAVAKAEAPSTPPDSVVAALDGPVKQFAGLPADWVVNAMFQLGDAYAHLGQTGKALAIYNEIRSLYPNSAYTALADTSRAQLDLDANHFDDALKIVQPIVDKAGQDIAPSPLEASAYARALIIYGRALESQGKLPAALEAFLTVKTMYYQNPNLVAEAEHDARDLRAKNPNVTVD